MTEGREDFFAISVDCYAGYRGEETPRRFLLQERKIEVVEVVDRWLAPDHRYFKVRGDDGSIYIIRHDVVRDQWQLTLFARAGQERQGAEGGARVD
ncbi:MAG: hypothetical protein HY789_08235 [Deltaproteobacteria bacterium]|nr:hypothetical protein [Deltaproteobacteria bacterium]